MITVKFLPIKSRLIAPPLELIEILGLAEIEARKVSEMQASFPDVSAHYLKIADQSRDCREKLQAAYRPARKPA